MNFNTGRRSFLGRLGSVAAVAGLAKTSKASNLFAEAFGSTTDSGSDNVQQEWTSSQITGKYAIPPDTPSWVHNAVFYQIYPQSFYDSNGDGIGDLPGIIQKLDYVASLGVDAVWINPFFVSPFGDGGYDIADFYTVAPRYGTNADARRLFEEAHKKGLKILIDFVASYTSIEHHWFKASAEQKKNKYSNWYIWTDNIWKNPPKQFDNAFIKGYGTRNGQYMLNFYYSEPALNYGFALPDPDEQWELPSDHPDVRAMREEMKNVLRFWLKMGADGFRADMAGALVKSSAAEERKSADGSGQYFANHDRLTKQFWTEIRGLLKQEYPEAFMISEWSYPESALDGCFHADFFHWFDGYNDLFQKESWRILNGYSEGHSYFDVEGKGNITYFLSRFMEQYERTKGKGYISLPLGNHDNARLGNKRSDDDLEIIYAFGLTMPGVTFIYYGNEIGMRQMPEEWPQVEGAYRPRNGARTPMQWAPGKNLGFSTAAEEKLYLPVDPSADAPTVEAAEGKSDSLLNRTRRLIRLKHSEPALAAYAEFVPLYAKKDRYPLIFARAKEKDVILVALNPSGQEVDAEFDLDIPSSRMKLLAGRQMKVERSGRKTMARMARRSYAIYKII